MHFSDFVGGPVTQRFLGLRVRGSSTANGTVIVFVHIDHHNIRSIGDNLVTWAQLNTAIDSLPQDQRPQLLFGFDRRERMLRFAAAIVNKVLASLLTRGEVQYVIRREVRTGEQRGSYHWHRASLESNKSELPGACTVPLLFSCICIVMRTRQEGGPQMFGQCIPKPKLVFVFCSIPWAMNPVSV